MALPPPPPPAPGGGPPPPPAIADNPKTYRALYQTRTDVLNGQYADLYAGFLTNLAPPAQPQTLRETVLAAAETVPSIFLCLIQDGPGRYTTRTVHRWTSFPRSTVPTLATAWDGRGFGFSSDVRPGNQISLVEIPDNAFRLTPNGTILDIAGTTAAIGTNVANAPGLIPAPVAGAAGTHLARSRYFIRVPQVYAHLVVGQRLTPRDLWNTLGTAIVDDNRAADCTALLDWLMLAATSRPDPADPQGPPLHPAVLLTDATGPTTLSHPEIDDALQDFIWTTLRADLPALDPSSLSPTDQVLALINVMRDDNARRDATAVAERQARANEKLPSRVFPALTELWMRLAEAQSEAELPPLYRRWANCTKGERRTLLERLIIDRAREPGAATAIPPVATKELYELIFSGAFGPTEHETDNFSKGFQPFLTAYTSTNDREVLSARAASYDLLMQGGVRPSLDETVALATTTVAIPSNTHEARTALAGLSVVSDVALGVHHRFSVELRSGFLPYLWPQIEHTLHAISTPERDLKVTLIPHIMRWCQIHMGLFFRLQAAGASPPLPPFDQLHHIIATRTHQNLPAIPDAYLARPPAQPPAQAPSRGNSNTGTTGRTPPATSGSNTGTTAPPAGSRGTRVNNPTPNQAWREAFNSAGRRITDLRALDDRPRTRRQGQDMDICLSYHLLGTCFDNCSRMATHEPTRAEINKIQSFVDTHLVNGAAQAGQSS